MLVEYLPDIYQCFIVLDQDSLTRMQLCHQHLSPITSKYILTLRAAHAAKRYPLETTIMRSLSLAKQRAMSLYLP